MSRRSYVTRGPPIQPLTIQPIYATIGYDKWRRPVPITRYKKRKSSFEVIYHNWSQVLFGLVVCSALGGYLWQLIGITTQYLRYETVVKTKFDRSVLVEVPAITICFPFQLVMTN